MQRGILLVGVDHLADVVHLLAQIVGQPQVAVAEGARGRGAAQVAVDKEYLPALDGEGEGEVHAHERLARPCIHGGDEVDVLVFRRVAHKLEVGAQQSESLVEHVLAVVFHHERRGRALVATLAFAEPLHQFLRPREARCLFVVGDFAHDGYVRAAFDVQFVAHGRVEVYLYENHECGEDQAEENGGHNRAALVGECGEHAAVGHVDDLRGHGGVGHADFVFLFLLQEIEVEALLHFLVALHRDEAFGLVGAGGHFLLRLLVVVLQRLYFDLQGFDVVADGGDDVFPHVGEFGLLPYNDGVLRRSAHEVVFQFEQQLVVLPDHCHGVAVGQPGVCGQQLVREFLVFENVEDILRHVHLVGEFQYFGFRLCLLLQIEVAHLLEVGNPVARLEGGDAVVHLVEFALDKPQAVVDEGGGAFGHLAFLFEPAHVEHVDNGAQHTLGPFGRYVVVFEVDDGGLLVVHRHGEPAANVLGFHEEVAPGGFGIETCRHVGEERERRVLPQHVGHIRGLLHECHVAEVLAGVLRHEAARRFVLHHHRRVARIDVGSGTEVVGGGQHGQRHRNHEPLGLAAAYIPEVLEREEVFYLSDYGSLVTHGGCYFMNYFSKQVNE